MRTAALVSIGLCCVASARTPAERLKDERLDAVHSQIVEWKKTRASFAAEGIYQDYRAVFLPAPAAPEMFLQAAHNAEVRVILGGSNTRMREGILLLPAPGGDFKGADIFGPPREEDAQRLPSKFKQHPDEAFGADTHALTEPPPAGAVLFAQTHLPPAKAAKDPEDAYTAAFRHATTHILATELSPSAIHASLAAGQPSARIHRAAPPP